MSRNAEVAALDLEDELLEFDLLPLDVDALRDVGADGGTLFPDALQQDLALVLLHRPILGSAATNNPRRGSETAA